MDNAGYTEECDKKHYTRIKYLPTKLDRKMKKVLQNRLWFVKQQATLINTQFLS